MTLNAWCRQGPWPERLEEIGVWIDSVDPDVVLLQEVVGLADGTTTAEEIAGATGSTWFGAFAGTSMPDVLRTDDDEALWGVAVLSRWPIDRRTVVALPRAGRHDSPPALHVRTGGIDVLSVHLAASPLAGLGRQAQVLVLDDAVRELADPESPLPPIVGGDMNADPDSDEVRFLCGLTALDGRTTSYQEAWRAAGPDEPGWTLTPANPHAATLNIGGRRIDHLFVGDPFLRPAGSGRVLAAALCCHQALTGTFASDHFGVVAEIGWPDRP